MARCVVLLRGINIGPSNRVSMAELRSLLAETGFGDVRTHLQSGNILLSTEEGPDAVARRCEALIAERFGLDIRSVVRTHAELDAVVRADPLADVVTDLRLYQVSFLEAAPDREVVPKLAVAAAPGERFVVAGREIYAWHPGGIARSRLATLLAGRGLKITATARNWATVLALLQMSGA
jgi:uncharacterized protein (DUF1697 family)